MKLIHTARILCTHVVKWSTQVRKVTWHPKLLSPLGAYLLAVIHLLGVRGQTLDSQVLGKCSTTELLPGPLLAVL